MVPTHIDTSTNAVNGRIRSYQERLHAMSEEANTEKVNHPAHYQHPSGIEVIEIVRHESFNRGNAIKYILRAGHKPGENEVDDLLKAIWYLQDEIARVKGENSPHAPNTVHVDSLFDGHAPAVVKEVKLAWSPNYRPKWSEIPDWVEYVAIDQDGVENWFGKTATIFSDSHHHEWLTHTSADVQATGRVFNLPNPNIWKSCLYQRPDALQKKKQDYADAWDAGFHFEPTALMAFRFDVDIKTIAQWWAEMTARDKARAKEA